MTKNIIKYFIEGKKEHRVFHQPIPIKDREELRNVRKKRLDQKRKDILSERSLSDNKRG